MKKFSSTMRGNSRNTSRNKKLRLIIIYAILALLLALFVPRVVAHVASLVLTPVHALQFWFENSSASFPYYLRDRAALIEELKMLKSQVTIQSGEQFTLGLLLNENKELRKLLSDTDEERIVAGVIGRPNKLPYDVLVIDKGSQDGILEGAPVYIGAKTVIGVIQKTYANSSVVELITSPHFSSSVYILGPDIYTTAVGLGGGQLRVGVPQGINLQEGDLVILPSASAGIYGAVSVVDSIPTRPEQYGFVSPEIPIASLRMVAVGDAPLEPVSFEQAQAVVAEAKRELFSIPIPEGVLVTAESTSTATTTSLESATTTP